ncbi:hypothetical protein F2P81_001391 [Scophthalmus maximus]|uniref:Uncharacterized protein n=1 Tax=Scophthalmus maximus TaxID=52904 RepID=A0A6A4TS40_SCOMX|nr:hypothetical protein F2P81_001391 [Scophthalmus maximus]
MSQPLAARECPGDVRGKTSEMPLSPAVQVRGGVTASLVYCQSDLQDSMWCRIGAEQQRRREEIGERKRDEGSGIRESR